MSDTSLRRIALDQAIRVSNNKEIVNINRILVKNPMTHNQIIELAKRFERYMDTGT